MNKLTPAVKAAVAANPQRKEEVLRPIANFQMQLKSNDLEQAKQTLAAFASLLKSHGTADDATAAQSGMDGFAKLWADAKEVWTRASDTVDAQIVKLQAALKKSDDEELVEIAEFGLNAVTGGFKVPLMAVIRDLDSAGAPKPETIAKARNIVADFHAHINSDERVAVCDDNPFGVAMSIRATLGEALAQMAKALKTA